MRCKSATPARGQIAFVTVSSPLARHGRPGDEGTGEAGAEAVEAPTGLAEARSQESAVSSTVASPTAILVRFWGLISPLVCDLLMIRMRSAFILSAAEAARSLGTVLLARPPLGASAPLEFSPATVSPRGVAVSWATLLLAVISLPSMGTPSVSCSNDPPCPNGSSSFSS
jgi:hypothetical protein